MAGNNIESDSKLQFYPTETSETYRILGILSGRPSMGWGIQSDKFKEEYGSDKNRKLYDKSLELDQQGRKVDFSQFRFETLLQEQRFDLINKYIKMDLGFSSGAVIADLFAGEGSWLKLFKQLSDKNILIGNELEQNRYNTMIKDGLIDYHYNLAFEELQLPKKIINVMLFNPPYGSSNSENNVRRYLRMTIERDLMVRNGIIVMVIKKRDALLCADLITQYFTTILCYKTHDEEYDKWGQVVLYAELRDKEFNLNNINDLANYKQRKEGLESLINMDLEFELEFYNSFKNYRYEMSNIKKAFEDFKYTKDNKKYTSNKSDKAWRWILKETTIRDLSEEVITIPKNLKSGELANVIASGKINGELSLENGIAKHIAVGGVKTIKNESKVTVDDKKTGQSITKLETTIQSIPYLNILINDNGKLKIKELKDISSSESEEQ